MESVMAWGDQPQPLCVDGPTIAKEFEDSVRANLGTEGPQVEVGSTTCKSDPTGVRTALCTSWYPDLGIWHEQQIRFTADGKGWAATDKCRNYQGERAS
jgi:hypothetical protein